MFKMPDDLQENNSTYELDTILEDINDNKVYIYVDYNACKIFEMCAAIAIVPDEIERTCKMYHGNYQGLIEKFCARGFTF